VGKKADAAGIVLKLRKIKAPLFRQGKINHKAHPKQSIAASFPLVRRKRRVLTLNGLFPQAPVRGVIERI
jgi:hypothetical protein